MNDPLDPLDSGLGTALRDRVADVHPDLDHLVTVSARAGARIRVRRRVGVSLAAVAGVAAVGVFAVNVAGGPVRQVDRDAPVATEPHQTDPTPAVPVKATNADGLSDGATVDLGNGDNGRVATLRGTTVILVRTMDSEQLNTLVARYPHTPFVWDFTIKSSGQPPVKVAAKNWFCQWAVPDDKGTCSTGGAMVSVNWRPAAEHAEFTSPAKADVPGAKAHTYVGDVHGSLFVTIQPMTTGTSQDAIDELAGALVWR